jgi:hypothetical protein
MMWFVPVKSPEQQSVMVLHRTPLILTRPRTQLSNAMPVNQRRVWMPICTLLD